MISSKDFLTVVSGLPRSGTSMMMRMLEAGGMPVLVDHVRQADDDNPRGYYEYERVKRTKADPSWTVGAEGRAVKMVYRLLYDMPPRPPCRVLFMRRNLSEVLASQRVMLERHSKADAVDDAQMEALFRSQLAAFEKWIAEQPHMKMLEVSYNSMLEDPRPEVARIDAFLEGGLDTAAMLSVVEPSLYRNRADRPLSAASE